jgi:hypothetical protein
MRRRCIRLIGEVMFSCFSGRYVTLKLGCKAVDVRFRVSTLTLCLKMRMGQPLILSHVLRESGNRP